MATAPFCTAPADQATRLRALAYATQPRAYSIAITSGKGGVGKTNLAVNLAVALAARGLRVTLVDLDIGLANADVILGVTTRYNLTHVIAGQRTLEEIVTPSHGGVRLIPGGSGLDQLAEMSDFERQRVSHALRTLDTSTDILLLDCGAGISRNVTTFAGAADLTLVVTTPEPTAMTDAYAMIKTIRHAGRTIGLVVNQASSRAESERTSGRIGAVAQKFLKLTIANAGYLLHDSHVQLAVRGRTPFVVRYPKCSASACVAAIAERLARGRSPARDASGFFKRVVGLFA